MHAIKPILLLSALTLSMGGIAHAGLAVGDSYNFTVWSGSYNGPSGTNPLSINGNADLADVPANSAPSAVFNYQGPLDFFNNAAQSSPNLASSFFGSNPDITNFASLNGQFSSVANFLATDVLSTVGFSGASLVTYMQITGTYSAGAGTSVTITHDDGASLYAGLGDTPVILSAGPVSQTASTGTLPATGPNGSNFMLVYVEANGAPSILQVTESVPVPEPASLALLGTGLLGLGLVLRRNRRG